MTEPIANRIGLERVWGSRPPASAKNTSGPLAQLVGGSSLRNCAVPVRVRGGLPTDGLAVWTASGLENRDDSFGMGVRLLGHPPNIRERCTGFLTPRQALMVFPLFSGCPSRNRTYILRVKVWYPTIRRPGRNFLVVVVGLEPTTSPLSGECSNQLSYTTTKKFGSHGRTRTCNHPVNSRKLYH